MKEKSGHSNLIRQSLGKYFCLFPVSQWCLKEADGGFKKKRVQYFSISMCLLSTSPSFKTEWWKSTRCSRCVHGLHFVNLIHIFTQQSPLLYFPLLLSLHQSSHWVCNLWDKQTLVKHRSRMLIHTDTYTYTHTHTHTNKHDSCHISYTYVLHFVGLFSWTSSVAEITSEL